MPEGISALQTSVANLVHSLLYLLMFIVFLSGYLMLTQNYSLFWIVEVPNMINYPQVNQFFFTVHRATCMALFLAITLHVLAVVKHQYIAKNHVLKLML